MASVFASCTRESTEDSSVMLKVATISQRSLPVSAVGITPVILTVDKRKGGNVTCADVAQAYSISFDLCGDKLDYGDYDFDGDYEFNGSFPLEVKVKGAFVSFTTGNNSCLKIADQYYKVGAVIVKGGNAANVYYYEEGILSDAGLSSPANSNGKPAGLSNLTFCFVECGEPQSSVIALKASYWLSYSSYENRLWGDLRYTCSTGELIYSSSLVECSVVGINYYPGPSTFKLLDDVGTVEIAEAWPGGVRSLIITVDLNENLIWNQTSLYLGSLAGLGDLSTCPVEESWPYQNETKQNTHVFTIPY